MANDMIRVGGGTRMGSGLLIAGLSAASFGLSGTLARGLLDAGWTPAAAVTLRVVVAALALAGPALVALRGRWHLLRSNAGLLLVYGLVAVAGCQFCYFSAVEQMDVGVALLIEYTAPVAVVGWLWLRHGHRPSRLMAAGMALAAGGLVLVLDLVGGAEVSAAGVLWSLAAMAGAAVYFVLSADEGNGLPPLVLAAAGLGVGAVSLVVAGALGALPMAVSGDPARYAGTAVPWWVPVLLLGLVSAAFAYVTGIAASRRLGPRLASFVALSEIIFGLSFAWLLLGQVPAAVQLAGGLLVVAGVVTVKLGLRRG